MNAIIEYVKGLPLMGDWMNWACLMAVAVILFCVATLMPKKAGKVDRIVSGVIVAAVAALLLCATLIRDAEAVSLWRLSFSVYVLAALTLTVLWGIFFPEAKLTQALYGIIITCAFPLGLLRLLLPAWAVSVNTFNEIFQKGNGEALCALLIFSALFFIPVWLIYTGKYRISLNTIWHMALGFTVGASGLQYMTQMNPDKMYSATSKSLTTILTDKGLDGEALWVIASIILVGVLMVVVASVVATLWRKKVQNSEEKVILSQTKKALTFRLVGRILSVVCGSALVIILPNLMNATTRATLLNGPKALVMLTPILLIVLINLVCEYLAENDEIKAENNQAE